MQITRVRIVSLMIVLNLLAFTVEAAPQAATKLEISGTPAVRAIVGEFYLFTPTVLTSTDCVRGFAVASKPAWAQLSIATGALSGIAGKTGQIEQRLSQLDQA